MYNNTPDNIKEMTQCLSQAFLDLSELNSKTFNKAAQMSQFGEVLEIKRPEDLLESQRNLQAEMNTLAMGYAQEVANLVLASSLNFMKHCSKLAEDAHQCHHETVKSGMESFKGFQASTKKKTAK